MPGFFPFIFVHFFNVLLVFPLLSCPCFCFVSRIQATTRKTGGGLLPFADLVVVIVY